MHLHTDDGVAVSAMEQGLMPITQHAMQCGEIACHDYEGVALDLDERERIVADLGEKQFMLLRNHGTLTVGPSVCSCFMAMYYLERACTMQVRALSGGAPPPRQPSRVAACSTAPPTRSCGPPGCARRTPSTTATGTEPGERFAAPRPRIARPARRRLRGVR